MVETRVMLLVMTPEEEVVDRQIQPQMEVMGPHLQVEVKLEEPAVQVQEQVVEAPILTAALTLSQAHLQAEVAAEKVITAHPKVEPLAK
jgi:hypothetical protein